jgi:hypothetical protein
MRRRYFREQSLRLPEDLGADDGDAAADTNGDSSRPDHPALLVGKHQCVQVNANHELPFTRLLEVSTVGRACCEVIGDRQEHASVDVAGRVAVVGLDVQNALPSLSYSVPMNSSNVI